MKLCIRNLHKVKKISTEKNFGKIEKKNFEILSLIFSRFFFSTPKAEPEGDRREPKGEFIFIVPLFFSAENPEIGKRVRDCVACVRKISAARI